MARVYDKDGNLLVADFKIATPLHRFAMVLAWVLMFYTLIVAPIVECYKRDLDWYYYPLTIIGTIILWVILLNVVDKILWFFIDCCREVQDDR